MVQRYPFRMVQRTPAMTSVAQLEHYLEEHLTKELAWLLRAATEWHAQHCMNLGIDGYSMQVY
ncbi:hypothetical protein GE300_21910, partial [Rhodobacteraceae bacterium 2CG4]|nr:hypothetical protein [Halovulum marinum]